LQFATISTSVVQLVFSFHSVKLHSTRDIFSLPTNFLKKERNCGRKKKHDKFSLFFFKFGNWSLCSSVIRPTTHTHTKTNNPTQFRKQKKEEVDFKRFLGFSSLGKTNHRVYTNKTKTGISKN
jgi:hypothetical protein